MSLLKPPELDFLEGCRVARLATAGPEQPLARPHCIPVCYALCQDFLWIAIDEKPKSGHPLRRLRNIAANPNVALILDRYEEDWSRLAYLLIEGRAALAALPEAARAELCRRYSQYDAMRLEQAIRIEPRRAVFWSASPP
jgi:PPOX class probable F420-dependent enzyme